MSVVLWRVICGQRASSSSGKSAPEASLGMFSEVTIYS